MVDADGFATDASCDDDTTGADSSTIGGAVALATAGDTIEVCPATYAELVHVNKALTILGNQSGVNASTRAGALESIVQGNAGSASLLVTADDVTIDGFTVRNQTNANQFGAGIVLGAGTSHASVLNNIVTNNVVGLFLANDGVSGQTEIRRNYFLDNDNPGPASGHGIYTDQFVAGGPSRTCSSSGTSSKATPGRGLASPPRARPLPRRASRCFRTRSPVTGAVSTPST